MLQLVDNDEPLVAARKAEFCAPELASEPQWQCTLELPVDEVPPSA